MAISPHSKSPLEPVLVPLALIAFLLWVCLPGLRLPELEGLDGAHHVMDGIFFHDLFTDLPLHGLASYPFDYYKQYPALGFIFWPPLFPVVEGLVFKLAGISLFTAQISIVLFGAVLAGAMYGIARMRLPVYPALATALLTLATPGLFQYFNVVMLEIPTLAMMALTTFLYLRIVTARTPVSWLRWQALAVVAVAALYTKQTAFVVFPALLADLLVNQRHLLKGRNPWLALVTSVVLVLPLVVFTLTFGKANIEQSVGQNTQLIMSQYEGVARWSWAGWLFYPKAFRHVLNDGVLALAVLEILFSLASLERLRRNLLWLSWLAAFYLVFSYFDNKAERFATLAVIPFAVLAVEWVWAALDRPARGMQVVRHGVPALVLLASVWGLTQKNVLTMHGVHEIMAHFDMARTDGNIAYLGQYRQVFVYDIRLQDVQRSHYVLQGDDILAGAKDVPALLHDYRVRYLFVEPDNLSPEAAVAFDELKQQSSIKPVFSGTFKNRSHAFRLEVLRYNGALADTMKPIELSSKLIK